jgi:hypothetical protein
LTNASHRSRTARTQHDEHAVAGLVGRARAGFSQAHTIAILLAEALNVAWMIWLRRLADAEAGGGNRPMNAATYPRRAASMAATSIFFIVIIAANARRA